MMNYIFWKNNLLSKSIFIFYYFHSIHLSSQDSCPPNKPFRVGDKTCADFNEICVKNDDQQCELLKKECSQCPPSNITAIMLLEIMNIVQVQPNFTRDIMNEKMGRLTVQFNSTETILESKMKNLMDRMIAGLVIWILLFIILLLSLIIVAVANVRNRRRRPNQNNYELIPPRLEVVLAENRELITVLAENCDTKFRNILSQIQLVQDKCDRLSSNVDNVTSQLNHVLEKNAVTEMTIERFEFYVAGLDIPIKLGVQIHDNIVKIKHQLCSKWINAKAHDYKLMKIMINETPADDNNYLLRLIKSPTDKIRCELDESIKHSNIIILQLQGNLCLPEFIQIYRSQMISNLKKIIFDLTKCNDMVIYKDSQALDDNWTIDDCKLVDYDWIKVIAIKVGKLSISSVFDDGPSISVPYNNNHTVSWIKNIMAGQLNCHLDDLILSYGSSYCQDDTFLFEMNLTSDSGIKYLNFLKSDRVILGNYLHPGDSSELYEASDKWTKKELVMKRYELASIKKLKDDKLLVNDLIKLQITKNKSSFVRTYGLYHDVNYFYIAMEKLKNSLEQELDGHSGFPKSCIPLWAKQILEGLSFLHNHNIVHGDIKPSNILLSEQNEIKLSVLGLSKYRHKQSECNLKKGLTLAKIGTLKYMAPEVSKKELFDSKADIYSFGVTLTELFYGKILTVAEPKRNEKFHQILDKLDITEEMKGIIKECWIQDYHSRPSAGALLDKDAFKC